MPIFAALDVYQDSVPRSAAMNMAIDEALLDGAKIPSLRLYRWDHAALSFGYFGRYADVSAYQSDRELVRRWTGGGIVFHGADLTYSIVIPRLDSSFSESPLAIYAAIHEVLCKTLVATGKRAELAPVAGAAVRDRNIDECFANPVLADVLLDGKKIAGAAQRRSRLGLLQQGSIQHVDLSGDFGEKFATQLAGNCDRRELNGNVLGRARQIAEQKYGTSGWLRKR
jgi:lipoate-protein ligase A